MRARSVSARDSFPDLPPGAWERLERVLERFEDAWRAGGRPALEDYLTGAGDERRALLIELVHADLHYRLKAGEAARVESYLGRFPELASQLRDRLQTVAAPDVPPGRAASPSGDTVALDLRDYELLDRVGRGGMGEVFRGRDPALGRDLAVKVLRPELRGNPDAEARFQQEARLTGALQHPNIVPVHSLGRLPDGRLYFSMKMVRGRTLAEILAEGAGADRLPELLGVFEKVCQAVAYAHDKGVIHRDLKPLNVMVGAFGEVQLMDWGLAKVLPSQPVPGSHVVAPGEGGDTVRRAWQTGSTADDRRTGVVGTPAYMPPEQARGAADEMDERADVFALGALLCELLTGRPPYAGASSDAVLRRAAVGDTAEALARLGGCGADAELVALCRECLAAERAGRPRDGRAVAERVRAYQAGVQQRLRQAELERAAAVAREQEARATARAERKARRRARALALTVLLLVVIAGGSVWSVWLYQQQRQARAAEVAQRRQQADAAAGLAMGRARLLLGQAKGAPLSDAGKFREARAAAEEAQELARTGEASDEVRQEAAQLAASLQDEAGAAERDRRLLAALQEVRGPREGPRYRRNDQGLMAELSEPGADEQFAAAFRAWDPSFDVDALPTAAAAARLRGRPKAVVTEVVAALDEWARERRQARPPGDWRRPADLAEALDTDPDSKRRELRALLVRDTWRTERALSALSMALRPVMVPFDAGIGEDRSRLRQLVAETDPATEPVLGLLTLAGTLQIAGDQSAAVGLLREAVRAQPGQVVLYHALGQLLEGQGRWDEAARCYAAARALRTELGEALANAEVRSGRVPEGLALYERLVARAGDNPWLHHRRGHTLSEHGRFAEAEAPFREALRLKPDFPEAHNDLGYTLLGLSRWAEAEASLHEAIRLKPDFPQAYDNLGIALHRQGRFREAEAAFRQVLGLLSDSPEAHYNLGVALHAQGRDKEAEASWREALRLQPDLPEAQTNLGGLLNNQGRYEEAEAACRAALRLRPDSPQAHNNLGVALDGQRRFDEAEVAYREAIRLNPTNRLALVNLGIVRAKQGRWKEAEAPWREAVHLQPDDPAPHSHLAQALMRQARFAEALESWRRVHALGSKIPGWPYPSGDWVRACERLVELDRRLPAVLRGEAEPASAAERLEFAQLCGQYKQHYASASRLDAEAFAADPRLANDLGAQHRYNAACYAALAAAGRGSEPLPDKAAVMLRRQALLWLRDDLALYARLADGAEATARQTVRQRLAHWRQDSDLAAVRDKAALDILPDNEQQACRRLWGDVSTLLEKVKK
jgi:serine/threonine-protein kinase